jgi:hypothetical protein
VKSGHGLHEIITLRANPVFAFFGGVTNAIVRSDIKRETTDKRKVNIESL